jgi:hypothetical protein
LSTSLLAQKQYHQRANRANGQFKTNFDNSLNVWIELVAIYAMRNMCSLFMTAFLCGVVAVRCQADTLDQQQLLYDGGTSARTLPGNTVCRSFTAGLTGTLTEIDMGFFNDRSGNGTLRIYSGQGTSEAILETLTVPVVWITQPAVTWNDWTLSVPIQAGL